MIAEIPILIVILFSAVILHEYAHGWVAYKCGDSTAKDAGRLSLNPLKHIDPFGTILLPATLIALRLLGVPTFIFGWAKPVPVNFHRLNNPRRDMIWVGLAGPLINIFLAVIFSQWLKTDPPRVLYTFMEMAIFFNLLLAVFNMIPIPPLDGSRLVMGLLPGRYAAYYSRLEPYGILIVVALIPLGLFHHVVLPAVVWMGHLLGGISI